MRLLSPKPIALVDGLIFGPRECVGGSLRVSGKTIAGVNCPPERGDAVVDLKGSLVLPGLINAHDHLELNNFPRLKWRDRYANASEWIADFQPRFATDEALRGAMSVSLETRLLIGGLKNLLSGVTTVCHHNPLYRALRRDFPVRVVRRYRYNHSLQIDGDSVTKGFLSTPKDWPWIIHAAEGMDDAASREFHRLRSMGCLGPNTVVVHGVALGPEEQAALIRAGGALVWCPSSNHFLFGTTVDITMLNQARRVALGTDSRLTGERDLLAEIRFAAGKTALSAGALLRMVTIDAASLLRLPRAGDLRRGAPADLLVIPRGQREPADSILAIERSSIRLVLLGGQPQIGDPDMRQVFEATGGRWQKVKLDGREKLMSQRLASRMKRSGVVEPGLLL
jgi:cytosine/adenosine deaminase-related metal-dependent hydrolase